MECVGTISRVIVFRISSVRVISQRKIAGTISPAIHHRTGRPLMRPVSLDILINGSLSSAQQTVDERNSSELTVNPSRELTTTSKRRMSQSRLPWDHKHHLLEKRFIPGGVA